ncbi:dopamine receptor 2-like [Dendronephthya gigantea]|uniref:dopamine receptor 2-like n=1 Tax=Dendronephthya gigantea TaxID=151771 RepID=UPI00106AAB72|nr:dopamine receptor 2-like [Dendronephthya gigantea]
MTNASVDSQPIYSEASIIGQVCFNIVIIIAALLGNSLVIATVCWTRKLRKPTNYFIVSLAVSDIFIAATIVPFNTHHNLNNTVWDLGLGTCKLYIFMDALCSAASTTNVAVIAIDRFLALSYPFKYQRLVNGKRSAITVISVWCYATILSSLSFNDWSDDARMLVTPACRKIDKMYYILLTLLGMLLPLVVLVIAYSMVFNLALRQAMMIKAQSTAHSRKTNADSKSDKSTQTRMLIRELKATKTLMIVVGTFLVCWFPLFVLLLIQQNCPECIGKGLSWVEQQIIGIIFVYTLPRLSSAANPIIYSVFNREFRSALCALCDRILGVLLPRDNVRDGVVPHRSRVGFCGMRAATDYTSSTHDTATYEGTNDYFRVATVNNNSRSPSVFTYKSPEIVCHETAV